MFCPKCGSQIPDNASFCAKCGAQVQAAAQAAQSAPVAAQSTPTSSPKRRPSGKLLGAIIAVIAVVAVVAAGFVTNWFGIMGGSGGNEPIYVLKSRVSTTASDGGGAYMETWEAELDERGNCVRVKGDYSTVDSTLAIEHDENGFVTKVVPADGSGDAVPVMNEFDALGRLARSSVHVSGSKTLHASYSYYGDTDKLSKVSYGYEGNADTSLIRLFDIIGKQLPCISYVWASVMSGGEGEVTYSEAGALTAYGASGSMTEASTVTREERAGRTIESGANSFTYDERGNLIHLSFETSSSSGDQDMTYELVASPSRAVATFGRLYS